jgi:hypothetical protein
MSQSATEYKLPTNRLQRSVFFGGDRVVDSTGPNGGKIIVYSITDLLANEVVYVGSGKLTRMIGHQGSRMSALIGHDNYAIDVLWDGDDDGLALTLETIALFAYHPRLNFNRWGTRGGRPRGIPFTAEQRLAQSIKMTGRASAWMKGRAPWNKGLTKEDERIARANATYADRRAKAGYAAWETRRKNGTTKNGAAWNKGLRGDLRLINKRKPMSAEDHQRARETAIRGWSTRRSRA